MARGLAEVEIDRNLERVGLKADAKRHFKTYSMGMKQRLALAHALMGEPELVIVDEPMNGLDPKGVVEMRELMTSIAAEGKTILISSHQLHEIQLICSRFVVLNGGRLLADEKIDAISGDLERHFFNLINVDNGAA